MRRSWLINLAPDPEVGELRDLEVEFGISAGHLEVSVWKTQMVQLRHSGDTEVAEDVTAFCNTCV